MTAERRHRKRECRLQSGAAFAKICHFAFEIKDDCVNPEHAQGKRSVQTFTQFQSQRSKADPDIANYSALLELEITIIIKDQVTLIW